jgi:hypothetical protein
MLVIEFFNVIWTFTVLRCPGEAMAAKPYVSYKLLPSHLTLPFDKFHGTRRLCYVGLIFSTIVAIAFIVLGCVSKGSQKSFELTAISLHLVPLSINVVITACTECLGLIHGTSLKWALFSEGGLEFNANLRLFSFCRNSWPHSRTINFVYLLGLALCYAASGTVLVPAPAGDMPYVLTRSGPACIGGALLTLCIICFWSMMATRIPTWSSSPLMVLAAAQMDGLEAREGRCMRSVHDRSLPAEPVHPQKSQRSANAAHHQVRNVLLAMSISLGALLLWFAITWWNTCATSACGRVDSELPIYWSLFPSNGNGEMGAAVTPYVEVYFFTSVPGGCNGNDPECSRDVIIFTQTLFTVALQSFITVGLHCAELQITLSRDEAVWRTVATPGGSDSNYSTTRAAITSWQSVILLVCKPVIHWIYGVVMYISYNGLIMYPEQILYLAIFWSLLLGFVSFVSLRKPKGPLPATYGHLQTLADLIDEWSGTMYWGHKGDEVGSDEVCHAGTSSQPLLRVKMNCKYE